jgi:hypothetical protein
VIACHGGDAAVVDNGDSGAPTMDAATTTTSSTDMDAGPPPARNLRTGSLTGTSPDNLLIDPSFAQNVEGWGHFSAYTPDLMATVKTATRTYSATPIGAAVPVAIVPFPATTGTATSTLMLSSFVGGPGPYEVSIWVSASDTNEAPIDLVAKQVKVTITGVTSMGKPAKSYDVPAVDADTQTTRGRAWHHYSAQIADALDGGGFFQVHLGPAIGSFWVTGPELVSKSLTTPTGMHRRPVAIARDPSADEISAIEHYRRANPPKLVGAKPPRAEAPATR